MPRLPSLIKPHPSRVNVTHLQLRLAKMQEGTLFNFLQDEFSGIDDSVAKELYLNLGEGVRPDTPVERLKGNTHHFYEQVGKIRFKGLSGDVSSPIGKAALSDGVKRLLKGEPLMLEFFYGSVQEYGANPFIVEVLVTLGSVSLKKVNKHTEFQDSRCLYAVSTDGAKQDFSTRKCLETSSV